MQIPPDDSIFSLPIWKKGSRDSRTSKIQMNPSTAYQTVASFRAQQLAIGVGMAIVLVVVVAGGFLSSQRKQAVDVQASFGMKRSFAGTIAAVEKNTNTFTVSFESSADEKIRNSKNRSWGVQLPPGVSFTRPSVANMNVCFSAPDIQKSLSAAAVGLCEDLIRVGRRALIEYLVLKPANATLIAKTIIVELPGN